MTKQILVIPDSHAAPNESLARFDWIGQLIAERQPDIIVDIGDRADLASLSTYDKGTKGFEGRRYKDDIRAVHEANELLEAPMRELNEKLIRGKRKRYRPRKIITMGNHEQRILRACNAQPELDGVLSYDDLGYEALGWEVCDFLEAVEVEGILFSHYFVSGVMGQPIGGVNAARSHLLKIHKSCISGHSHLFDYAEETDPTGRRIQALVCGVAVEESPSWNNVQSYNKWSSGVVMLNNVEDGQFDFERISMKTLEEMYG